MPYDPDIHHRRSIRLKDYDYSLRGLYFVTICTHDHIPRFGDVVEGAMILNSAGQMIERLYKECEHHFDNLRCLDYVVMPNHFHCIFQIVETASPKSHQQVPSVGAGFARPNPVDAVPPVGAGFASPKMCDGLEGGEQTSPLRHATLGQIVAYFKYQTSKYVNLPVRLWQRNYYEHVIRSQHSYDEIVEYIRNNPKQWYNDKLFHP